MSASNKYRGPLMGEKTKSFFDRLVDFGSDSNTAPELTDNQNERLKKVIEKIDEISKRIDRLTEEE